MKNLLTAWAFSLTAIYLLTSFAMWDMNPGNWGIIGRSIFAGVTVFLIALFLEWKYGKKG